MHPLNFSMSATTGLTGVVALWSVVKIDYRH